MIKVTALTGKVIEGEVYSFDHTTRSLAIKTTDGTYTIINPSNIYQIQGNASDVSAPADPALASLNSTEIEQQEDVSLKQAEKAMDNMNLQVPGDIQSLYDKISLLFTACYWKGNDIIVLDEYSIGGPLYKTVRVLPGKEGNIAGIDRIAKILDGERRKLKLTS